MYINNVKYLSNVVPPKFLLSGSISFVWDNNVIKLKRDYLADFFDVIYQEYLNTNIAQNQTTFSIELSSKVLQKKYGNKYKNYIKYFIAEGYIIDRRNYLAGSHCYCYRINIKKLQSTLPTNYINYNKKIIIYYNSDTAKVNSNSKVYSSEMIKSIGSRLKYITIDYNMSIQILNKIFKNRNCQKYQKNHKAITDIKDGNFYLVSDKFGRIHTNFTVLKKQIKKLCVKIDNQPICEKDISNSQALFFLHILSRNLDDSIDRCEFLRFGDRVRNGTLYNQLSSSSGKTRDYIKKRFFKYLFGSENAKFKDFISEYPTISDFIKNYKFQLKSSKELSHQLQRLEGDFIFNKVCKKLKTKRIKFFTVHDSICAKTSDYSVIDKIFENELNLFKLGVELNTLCYYSKKEKR